MAMIRVRMGMATQWKTYKEARNQTFKGIKAVELDKTLQVEIRARRVKTVGAVVRTVEERKSLDFLQRSKRSCGVLGDCITNRKGQRARMHSSACRIGSHRNGA